MDLYNLVVAYEPTGFGPDGAPAGFFFVQNGVPLGFSSSFFVFSDAPAANRVRACGARAPAAAAHLLSSVFRRSPPCLKIYLYNKRLTSVCVFLMDAETVRPIVSKLCMVIEGHLAGNIGVVQCA